MSTRNLLDDLRGGTEVNHRRVEKHTLVRPLTASTLTLEQYAKVIAAFTGFYEILEPRIEQMFSSSEFPDYRYQPRLPLLVDDLAALPICAVTPCTTVPEFSRGDELVGVLYVLEGATQGGRVIAPLLRDRLALTQSAGARYFNFYHQQSWQDFCNMVGRSHQLYDHRLAVAAARDTFDRLYSHLELCLCRSGEKCNE